DLADKIDQSESVEQVPALVRQAVPVVLQRFGHALHRIRAVDSRIEPRADRRVVDEAQLAAHAARPPWPKARVCPALGTTTQTCRCLFALLGFEQPLKQLI